MSLFNIFRPSGDVPSLDADALRARLKEGSVVLLDVREQFEHARQNIPKSLLIPLGQLQRRVGELEPFRDREIVVYCRSGNRSHHACLFLAGQGFKVMNLEGGILRW